MRRFVFISVFVVLVVLLVGVWPWSYAKDVGVGVDDADLRRGVRLGPDVVEYGDAILDAPVSGEVRVLVVYLDFSNYQHQLTRQDILNKVYKVDQYIREVSYGKTWLTIVDIGFWLQLNRTREYYGADSGNQIDVNWPDYVYDGLKAADPYIDYNTVDYVMLVHAGYSQPDSGDPNDLWSRASRGKVLTTFDGGARIGWMILAERDPIGVYAHELGHNLGLVDLYDRSYQRYFVGRWSLMAFGVYLNPPASFMAVEKDWLGWLSPSQITTVSNVDTLYNITLYRLEEDNPLVMVKIPAGTIYFTVEYRRKVLTDSGLPNEGIIIARVDENKGSGRGRIVVMDRVRYTPSKDDAAFKAGDTYVNATYDFYVKVDSLGQTDARIYIQRGVPNLYIINTSISKDLASDAYDITVEIGNSGGPTHFSFKIDLIKDYVVLKRLTVNQSIARNGSIAVTFQDIPLPAGNNTLKIKLDIDNDVPENNEKDNTLTWKIYIQPEYILDMYRVEAGKERVDIGSNITIYLHFRDANNNDYGNGLVVVNGTSYSTNGSGWIALTVSSDRVGRVRLYVTDRDALQEVTPEVIFDKVVIKLKPDKKRIDVGSTASIQVDAYYAYDNQKFYGDIYLNDSLKKDTVGKYFYTVDAIDDQLYGLTAFESNTVSIIYDMVVIELEIDERVNIGEENPVRVYAYYAYDNKSMEGTVLFSDSFGKTEVGHYWYHVIGINETRYGLTVYQAYPKTFMIIYDMVNITLKVDRERVDVGKPLNITVEAYYLYDGQPYNGYIIFNNSLTQEIVGRYSYTVLEIGNDTYGITVFQANIVTIVFDRIMVELNASDTWINIGEYASISIYAYYEYDGSIFNGTVILNNSLTQSIPGRYGYTVEKIIDPLYGLTAYRSNTVSIIFDAVEVIFNVEDNRIDVGSTANITFTARYAYSKEPYPGVLALNDSLTKDEVGLYWYGVVLIEPDPNNITALYYQPVYIIFDRVVIETSYDNRVNIGENALQGVNAYYEYDGEPFNGEIYFNDTAVKHEVGRYAFKVIGIRDDRYGLTVFKAEVVTVIFDKVVIELSPVRERYDVGKEAELAIDAYYAYDGTPYNGEIIFNMSLIQYEPGLYYVTVARIGNDSYGITVFEANTVAIIFDRVVITLYVGDERIDVGSKANITWKAYYEYDGKPFQGDIILNNPLSIDEVGNYSYTVKAIEDRLYGLTMFKSNTVYIVFDMVVIELEALDNRINIGEEARIRYTGYYAYDGMPFNGEIFLNDTLKKDMVGRYFYTVESIKDPLYGLTAFKSNIVSVIYDKVIVELSVDRIRVDIGSTVNISINAYYAYDGQPYTGEVVLNGSLTYNRPGEVAYTVKRVGNDLYGITIFESNTVKVIFDYVVVELKPLKKIYKPGEPFNISIEAYYVYDGKPFQGEIYLNDSLVKNEIGVYRLTVEAIRDDLYGLTIFKSNTVEVRVDILRLEVESTAIGPFKYRVKVSIYSTLEEGYVDADVYVNGRKLLDRDSEGRYIGEFFTLNPMEKMEVYADVNGEILSNIEVIKPLEDDKDIEVGKQEGRGIVGNLLRNLDRFIDALNRLIREPDKYVDTGNINIYTLMIYLTPIAIIMITAIKMLIKRT